jgi:hypothetical protein
MSFNARMSAATGPSDPRPFSTHGITLEEGIAVKRFRSHVDGERRLYGNEPRREWRALKLLARYAPGLAPRPIRAELDAESPLIAMSQVPGEPLGSRQVTGAQEDAIAASLSRLHHAIPPSVLATVGRVPASPSLLPGRVRDMARVCDADGPRSPGSTADGQSAPPGSPGRRCSPRATLTSPTTYGTDTACTWWTLRLPGVVTGPQSLLTSPST